MRIPTPTPMISILPTDADSTAVSEVAAVLAEAFHEDPVSVWVWPEPTSRRPRQQAVFARYLLQGQTDGLIYTARDHDGSIVGAALWLSAAAAATEDPDEKQRQLALAGDVQARARLGHFYATMNRIHPTEEPHHYLLLIGVRPDRQGTGVGSALLQAHHRTADAAGLPVYLEATTPRSATLYQRHGYHLMKDPVVVAEGVELRPMWRAPVSAHTTGSAPYPQ